MRRYEKRKKKRSLQTDAEREAIIEKALSTEKGRKALAKALCETLKLYHAI